MPITRRIGYVYDGTVYGGVEHYIITLMEHLKGTSFSPAVVIPGFNYSACPARFLEQVRSLGIPLLVPPDPGNSRAFSFVKDVLGLRTLIKQSDIGLLHIMTSNFDGGRRATLAAKMAGIQVVRTEHVPPSSKPIATLARIATWPFDQVTSATIAVSESNREEQVRLLRRRPGKVLRSHFGVNLDDYPVPTAAMVADSKRLMGIDPAERVIGCVGRLAGQKGHTYLLDAFARVASCAPAVTLVLVGDGPLEGELRAQAEALGIADRVRFLGFRSDYRRCMAGMDIAAMPSIYEGFSITMLEFMALARPTVTSDHPSFLEALTPETGVTTPMRDGRAMGAALLELVRDPARAEQLGQRARERVAADFSLSRLVTEMTALYERVLSGRSPGIATAAG
jgi:glycosyltransferase involved in cell wall biosynthesis